MACDISYLLRRAEIEAVRTISSNSDGVAAVHQEMCLLYTGQAIAGLIVAALDRARRGDHAVEPVVDQAPAAFSAGSS